MRSLSLVVHGLAPKLTTLIFIAMTDFLLQDQDRAKVKSYYDTGAVSKMGLHDRPKRLSRGSSLLTKNFLGNIVHPLENTSQANQTYGGNRNWGDEKRAIFGRGGSAA